MDESPQPSDQVTAAGSASVIRGLGVDIVEIERMRLALQRHPKMKTRIFSQQERDYCERRNRPEVHYAMRFAAKEAVLKAIGTGFSGMRFVDVEVLRDGGGRPRPVLHGRAAEVAEQAGVVELHLSLSFTHQTAVASAVAITAANRPRPPAEPESAEARFAASFKEARSLLDELQPGVEGEETSVEAASQESGPER